MEVLQLEAKAKINLGLDVLRRREDGYHEVKMVMQTVGICDRLEFTKLLEDDIRIEVGEAKLPADGHNLIYKAARLMKDTFGIRGGVHVKLEKNIPIAAGMAGGSTDAAAAIHAMDRLFGLGLTLAEKQRLGVRIGADVPYCLMGGTALAEGIGEVLTALPAAPAAHLVIAKPDIHVSTAYVYGNLHADALKEHPDIDGMAECIRQGDISGIAVRMGNVLETVTEKKYPIISEMKMFLKEQGAANALMSGSGPTVFGIFKEEETAGKAYAAMREKGYTDQIFLTEFTD